MAKLVFIGAKFSGRIYEFVVPRTTVGRGDHNTLTIHDSSVSQTHCEIYAYGEDVIVRDLGSSNGTFVNGERLHKQQRPLKSGQTVSFGTVEARLEAAPAAASSTDTDITAFHANARYTRKAAQDLTNPLTAPLILESDSEPGTSDHTSLLRRPPEAPTPVAAPATPGNAVVKSRPPWARLAGVVAVAVLALGLILWLLLGGR